MGGAVSAVTDVVSDVVGGVGDIVGGAVDAIGDAGSWIDDNVIQPVLDDPVNSAIKLGAYYFGGPIAGAAATAAVTAAQGGELEDIAKSAATSYAAGQVGGAVGGEVGSTVAGQTGSQAAGQIAGGALGGAAAGATGQALSGGNVGQGFLTGLISGGVNSGVNTAGNAISNAYYTGSDSGTYQMGDNFQIFDDGTSLQTFDDGSAIYSDTSGQTYVLDTNSGYAQAINSATGQPIGVASNSLFDSVVNAGKTFASTALKSLIGGATGQQQQQAGQGGLITGGVNAALTAQQLGQLQNVYQKNLETQAGSVNRAVNLASFNPFGMTTAFGTSQFQRDPVTGQITSAGYTASPELAAQRERLFSLGTAALPTTADTQAVQQQYIAQQQGLLAPGREQQLAQLRNRQFQRGTTGLATGGTRAGYAPNAAGLMATNPEMAAYYNSLAQADAQLAANAPTYAQNLLNQQIQTGTGLFGAANTLEGYAQQPLTLSSNIANLQATAGGRAGQLGLLGGQNIAATQLQGNLAQVYGQGQALGSIANPLAQAAQQGLSTAIGNWLS
jgi:hypothetical protein